ncbi:TrbG/VirB9 family P-type conjugative transfer protein [Rickettsiales endosymbiont of Stachyamoeba lipophora]|uniref:TrbG/VirB9 family P-type conjugative transfer protein n=1 Tax=Rickettsiales endosymbiont of Stachyamoeba lipophora TaxID=2486578 RepID=UPI000F653ACD|nr:TrbG/VirB9 family P-type conjugative transfer protein [Rickettsiales endosymbiont of Stachyamoeba lipophora]AZL16432.1 hypothetical protein EF513_07865 [Rickettsiales endosymbiont of Stachyamoeba lipophora]
MKYYHKITLCLLALILPNLVSAEELHNPSQQGLKVDSRIKTFVYDESDIYKIVVHKGFQTSIELGSNEEVETISLGAPYAWTITPVGRRIFIKPHEENIHTNMSIITNKRSYQFEVLAKKPSNKIDDRLAYVVRFYYPSNNNNDQ